MVEKFNYDPDSLCDEYEGVTKAVGSIGRTFKSYDTDISINSDFNRKDYEYFRPSSKIPTKHYEVLDACMDAYTNVGLIHNIINMMSEFGCDGIHLTHPVPSVQRFYRRWFEKVGGYSTSERFLNYLYRCGNVFTDRKSVKVDKKTIKEWKKSFAINEDFDFRVSAKEIPVKYTFYNPLNIDIITKSLDGNIKYGLKISYDARDAILRDRTDKLSDSAIKSLKIGNVVPLDDDKLIKFFYKKDDWCDFGSPMIRSILPSLIMLEKMHLADISALDGAISSIRLWRLGIYNESSPASSIFPTRAGINKLRNILHNRATGGNLDLIWGFELDFKESDTKIHNFLGKEKYEQVMMEIYAGIGVPMSLIGEASMAESGTGSFMSLQTVIKRLEYGRNLLKEFWKKEIKIVQKAMGFTKPASVQFSSNLLNDEGVRNKLLMDLVDRNIISEETLLQELAFNSDLESVRLLRELKSRKKGSKSNKLGPYKDPDERLKEIILQNGGVAPSEVGLILDERKPGDKPLVPFSPAKNATNTKKAPKTNGRPSGSKDTQRRKQKTIASDFVNMFIWAKSAQDEITELLNPFFTSHYNKKNIRSLSYEERYEVENFKFNILSNLSPFQEITKDNVYNILKANMKASAEIVAICKILTKQFIEKNNRNPSYDEIRQIQASAFATNILGDDDVTD